MKIIEKRFGTFTHYCLTVQELLVAGFVHTNENCGSVKKNEKAFRTAFAGSTTMAIHYPEQFAEEVDQISKNVFDKIQARKKV